MFQYKTTRLIFKHPIQYENDEFIQRLCKFLLKDLSMTPYLNLKNSSNTFYLDIIKDKLEFVSPNHFTDVDVNIRNFRHKTNTD